MGNGSTDDPRVDLQAEVARRKAWLFECQLRRLNMDRFREVTVAWPDPLMGLISEPLMMMGHPAGQIGVRPQVVGLRDLGPVYLDSQQPVWTPDEQLRRGTFAGTLTGKTCNWLEFREPIRLAEALAGLQQDFEKSRFSSVIDLGPTVNVHGRQIAADDGGREFLNETGNMGHGISRASIAEMKPWLIPELYHPKHPDSAPPLQWLENLEQFILDFEGELGIAVGGIAGTRPPFDPANVAAYRAWLSVLLDAAGTRDAGDCVQATFLDRNRTPDGKDFKYQYNLRIRTSGFALGNAVDFPHSFKVKYWTRIVRSSLGEVYLNKANSDMGLCILMRVVYLFGDMPAAMAPGQELPWRRRSAPSPQFDEFFSRRASEPGIGDNQEVLQRLRAAQAHFRAILEESAAHPRSASPVFSPIVQEVLRQGIRTYKFWLDEEFRARDNAGLNKARADTGVGDQDAEMEYWSENHYIMFASCEYLAGQLWEADEFQPGPEFLDAGSKAGILSGRQRKERGRARVLKWLNNRLMFGWTEFNSSGYYREHLWAILNLADFALDREVRDKAAIAIDLLLFDVVRFTHKGSIGAAGGRCQFKSKASGWDNALGDVVEILLGTRGVFCDSSSLIGTSLASSTYRIPDVLLEIGVAPPGEPFIDRSRVSITFEEAPKYGITCSMQNDAFKSLLEGYASRRARHYPFLDELNREIERTHREYTPADDDIVFWWGTSAFYNKQIVRGTLRCIETYGLGGCPVFKGFLPFLIGTLMPLIESMKNGFIGGLLGGPIGGIVNSLAGIGDLLEEGSDDLSLLLEGSTRTRANILTYRNSGAMLSSMQNFRAGQLNFQSNVNQATLNGALGVFTSAGFEGLDISNLPFLLGGAALGVATGVGGVAGAIAGVAVNQGEIDGLNPFGDDKDGPGWWTGYWALPRVVQHRSAAILMYDFEEVQEFLAETGSHVWFPNAGFDRSEEVRTSAYDDGNFFLLDVDNIGPKGFWLFGKVVHQAPGVPVADRSEGYIGVFSNQRPEWLDLGNDEEIYGRRREEVVDKPIDKLKDEIEDKLDELDDEDNVGYVGRQLLEIATIRATKAAYAPNIARHDWIDRARKQLAQADSALVQRLLAKLDALIEKYVDLWTLERIWNNPPRDYFAGRDWYVNGKNIWIVQVGSKDEFGSYEAFRERVTGARVTVDDSGDMECTYHIPLPGGGSESISMKHEDGGEFSVNGQSMQTDLYPRFENPFIRGGRVEWGQRSYVIEHRGKLLVHDFSDFANPRRAETLESGPDSAHTVKAFVIFQRTADVELEEFTTGTAAVRIGCEVAAEEQVIAVGPVDEDTDHDAEWIFCDRELIATPDLALTLKHHAFGEGDDDAEWEVGFSLKALMGDYTLKDCTLSFAFVSFDEDRQAAGPIPFSILLSQWRRWEPVPDERTMRQWFIADRPQWNSVYYDYVDLLALDGAGRIWHKHLTACFFGAPAWRALPQGIGGPSFDGAFCVCAISTSPENLTFFAASGGELFITWLESGRNWVDWVNPGPWVYAPGLLGLPDPSLPPLSVAAAAQGPVFAGSSASTSYAIEVFFLGTDGNLYAHHDWRPGAPGPWHKIKVSGFSVRAGGDAQVIGDRLFVLSAGGALWTRPLRAAPAASAPFLPSWEALSPPWMAISRFAVFQEQGTSHVVTTASDGSLWATMLAPGSPVDWIALGMPNGSPVPVQVRVAGASAYAGHLDIFAVASDGLAYTTGWSTGTGWGSWRRMRDDEQGFAAAPASPAVAHRVNRQLELFVQARDGRLFRTWWS